MRKLPSRMSAAEVRAHLEKTRSEADFQKEIVAHLRHSGFIVLQTNQAKRKIEADFGVPDLLVRREKYSPAWPDHVWVGIELKTAKGAVKPEQQSLAHRKCVVICRTSDDVFNAIHSYEDTLIEAAQTAKDRMQWRDLAQGNQDELVTLRVERNTAFRLLRKALAFFDRLGWKNMAGEMSAEDLAEARDLVAVVEVES